MGQIYWVLENFSRENLGSVECFIRGVRGAEGVCEWDEEESWQVWGMNEIFGNFDSDI